MSLKLLQLEFVLNTRDSEHQYSFSVYKLVSTLRIIINSTRKTPSH